MKILLLVLTLPLLVLARDPLKHTALSGYFETTSRPIPGKNYTLFYDVVARRDINTEFGIVRRGERVPWLFKLKGRSRDGFYPVFLFASTHPLGAIAKPAKVATRVVERCWADSVQYDCAQKLTWIY